MSDDLSNSTCGTLWVVGKGVISSLNISSNISSEFFWGTEVSSSSSDLFTLFEHACHTEFVFSGSLCLPETFVSLPVLAADAWASIIICLGTCLSLCIFDLPPLFSAVRVVLHCLGETKTGKCGSGSVESVVDHGSCSSLVKGDQIGSLSLDEIRNELSIIDVA